MSKLGFSTFNHQQINQDPFNSSPSKAQYSFQKDERFKKYNTNCPQAYYPLPDKRDKRATSFGYGIKSDFTKTTAISPSPYQYNKQSDFDKHTSVKKGKSFGLAREQMKEYGHIIQQPLKNPGVGNYEIKRDLQQISYTLKGRSQEPNIPVFLNGKRSFQQAPGPGTYEVVDAISKNGKQFFSKYQTSSLAIIHPSSSQRFPNNNQHVPGPNHYIQEQSQGVGMQKNAKYVLSQHQGQGTRAFSQDKRIAFTERISRDNHIVPGVGSYRQPSQFGIYEGGMDNKRSTTNTLQTNNSKVNTHQ